MEELMREASSNVKSSIYWQMKVRNGKIRIVTKSGWESDICEVDIEEKYPGGLWAVKDEKVYFVPFDSVELIQYMGAR